MSTTSDDEMVDDDRDQADEESQQGMSEQADDDTWQARTSQRDRRRGARSASSRRDEAGHDEDNDEGDEDKSKHLAEMQMIQQEYTRLQTRLYERKIAKIEENLAKLAGDTLAAYLEKVQKVEEEFIARKAAAESLRKFKTRSLENVLNGMRQEAAQTYEDRLKNLKVHMMDSLRQRRRSIHASKNQLDTPYQPPSPSPEPFVKPTVSRSGRLLQARERRAARVSLSEPVAVKKRRKGQSIWTGPFIVYMLGDDEVEADLRLLNTRQRSSIFVKG